MTIYFLNGEEYDPRRGLSVHIGGFYFLTFWGNHVVGWFRAVGRMDVTFWGTTIQIIIRVILSYLMVDAMGLSAVALATGIGWIVIISSHTVIFLLERRKDPNEE